jgi:hypothetical protein
MSSEITNIKELPQTNSPLVIRTDFKDPSAWKAICKLIRAPVQEGSHAFQAYVEFLDDVAFRDLSAADLLARVPKGYRHTFLVVVDRETITGPDHPLLVVDLHADPGRTFRALPTQVQSIENNLSIANMDFFEFADNVAADGIFRGFPKPDSGGR